MQSEFTPEALLAHSDWIRRLITGLVRDPGRREDVLQETWMAALQHPPRQGRNVRSWLASVALNTARKGMRGEGRRRLREQTVARLEAIPDTVDVIAKARMQGRMVEAVLGLEEPYRTPVLLRFFEELPPREIARRLDRPKHTVQSQIQRGLALLRSELDAEYGDREAWGMAFLPLVFAGNRQAATGTLLTHSGGGILWMKWLAATLFIALGWLGWNSSLQHDSQPTTLQPIALQAPGALLQTPVASAQAPKLETGRSAPAPQQVAGESPEPALEVHRHTGRCVDLRGMPMAGLELSASNASIPEIRGGWLGEVGKGVEITPEFIERLRAEPGASVDYPGGFLMPSEARALLQQLEYGTPSAATLSDGSFSIDAPFERARLDCMNPQHAVAGEGWLLNDSGNMDRVVVIAERAVLRGTVVDSNGNPVAGAQVQLRLGIEHAAGFPLALEPNPSQRFADRVDTDAGGRFQFLPQAYVPGAQVLVTVEGYPDRPAALPTQVPASLDIVLQSPPTYPKVSGLVVDANGLPVTGATVRITSNVTRSDDLGHFDLEIRSPLDHAPEGGVLMAYTTGSVPALVPNFASKLQADPGACQDLVLRLGGPTGSIGGRVVDGAGNPLQGVRLYLKGGMFDGATSATVEEQVAANWYLGTNTDREGRFEVPGLFQGSYTIEACDRETMLAASAGGIAPGSEDVVLTLDASTCIPLLKGRVVDRRGLGVSGAKLRTCYAQLESSIGSSWLTREMGQTDANGFFELEQVATQWIRFEAVGLQIQSTDVDLTGWRKRALAGELMQIVVPLKLQFQLSAHAARSATRLSIVNSAGIPLVIKALYPGESSFLSGSMPIPRDRPLPTFEVDEEAAEVLLYAEETILRRIPLDLKRGEITQLQ